MTRFLVSQTETLPFKMWEVYYGRQFFSSVKCTNKLPHAFRDWQKLPSVPNFILFSFLLFSFVLFIFLEQKHLFHFSKQWVHICWRSDANIHFLQMAVHVTLSFVLISLLFSLFLFLPIPSCLGDVKINRKWKQSRENKDENS